MGAIGQKIPHDSAFGHVTGQAIYTDDIPFAKDELLVDFFGSPVAHGKILSIDLEDAKQVAGIKGIYTFKDIPGHNKFGSIIVDEHFLAEGLCEYVGQPIVVLAATNRKALKEAKKRIQIEIQAMEPVLTIEHAITKQQFLGEKRFIKRGDIKPAFEASKHIIEGTFHCNGQEQFYLESQVAVAYPGEQNEIKIHSSTQHTSEVQEVVADLLGIGKHDVISECKRMGGAFGGKETQAAIPTMMVALVAYYTKCPARVVYTKDDDMKVTGKRHPYQAHYKAAFTNEGEITAVQIDYYSNGGIAADLSTAIMERTMLHTDNAYYIPNILIHGSVCKTNLPPNTAFRGFGGPQGIAAIENILEDMAIYLKKDAYDLRLLNCYQTETKNITPYGQLVSDTILTEIFEKLSESSEYKKRVIEIKEYNKKSQTHLRGIAMTPVKFGISFTTKFLNQGNALVNVFTDGTIQVSTGGTEMGQGLNTKIRQIVADEFGVSYDKVKLMITSTEKNSNTSPTAASAGTDLNGMAAIDACQKIKKGLIEFAGKQLASSDDGISYSPHFIKFDADHVFDERAPDKKITFPDLVISAYRDRINLGARGFYRVPGVDFNRETGKGNPFYYYTTGGCVSEVLIDRFTGDLTVERVDILMDIGESINPGIDMGQLEGGFIQGMGWVTNEELRYQDDGNLLSYSPTTYKIPNIQDLPKIFNVNTIKNPHHQINVGRSKAVGEPPVMLAISVWTAVKNALSFISKGKLPKVNIPATNEEILKRITQYASGSDHVVTEYEIPLIPKFSGNENKNEEEKYA